MDETTCEEQVALAVDPDPAWHAAVWTFECLAMLDGDFQ